MIIKIFTDCVFVDPLIDGLIVSAQHLAVMWFTTPITTCTATAESIPPAHFESISFTLPSNSYKQTYLDSSSFMTVSSSSDGTSSHSEMQSKHSCLFIAQFSESVTEIKCDCDSRSTVYHHSIKLSVSCDKNKTKAWWITAEHASKGNAWWWGFKRNWPPLRPPPPGLL